MGYAIAVASIAFAFQYLGVNATQFRKELAAVDILHLLGASGAFLVAAAINACGFGFAFKSLSRDTPAHVAATAWLSSLLSKYIPIGVGHVAGRGVLLVSRGATWRTIAGTGIAEQFISLTWCIAIGWAFYRYDNALAWGLVCGLALFGLCLGVPACLQLWRYDVDRASVTLAVALYGLAMAPYVVGYLLLVQPEDIRGFVAALFAGTVAGVLAVISPGGLGVRESVAAASAQLGAADDVIVGMLAARVAILASEVAGSLVGLVLFKSARRQ